jgi:pimeloyl-ACP methyl ester carboxylesterase
MNIFQKIWYDKLKQPYVLSKIVDKGSGTPVIMLHGIGKTNVVWKHVIEGLAYFPVRIVAFDLLGFGDSIKPTNIDYGVDDHAKAVIRSIEKLKAKEPAILIGHSMGCLIAVRVARLRPDLVRHLVLYEMPLYEGLPEKRIYRLRLNIYAHFYSWVINYKPEFTEQKARMAQRIAKRVIGFEVDPSTWLPFIRSLENTIMHQTAAEDIKYVKAPMDVIYGSLDMFVIRGKTEHVFGSVADNISTHNVRAKHIISTKASSLIVQRVVAALHSSPKSSQ